MKRFLSVFILFAVTLTSLSFNGIPVCAGNSLTYKTTDYVSLFGDFVDNDLFDFLKENYNASSVEHFRDCYMVDMNNNSVPELLCLFIDDHDGLRGYAALIEYDNGFKMGTEIPFDFYDGSESLWYQILEKDGKFYFEKFISSTYSDGMISESELIQTITINQNGIDTVVYSAILNGYINFNNNTDNHNAYINGQRVDELDYEYVRKNFNIVADSADYNYSPFTTEEPQHNYGNDYDKFWKPVADITVTLDGNVLEFDQNPIIVNSRTMVPLRAIFESLGATVEWDQDTQTVTSVKGDTTISMTIGKAEMKKNEEVIVLDVAPQIVGNRTLVPVRAVAESFNCIVDWDGETQTVIIKSDDTKTETLGNKLLAYFETIANDSENALSVAEAIASSESIAMIGCGAIPVEEGYLVGFDDTEIKGFKEGAMFAPMIGTIPFVGYIFTLEDGADTSEFIEVLKNEANLRWNICTAAEEMVVGSAGNKVFFIMCPESLENAE